MLFRRALLCLFITLSPSAYPHGDEMSADELSQGLEIFADALINGSQQFEDGDAAKIEAFMKLGPTQLRLNEDPSIVAMARAAAQLEGLLSGQEPTTDQDFEGQVSGRFLWEDWKISDNLSLNRKINDQWAWLIHNRLLAKLFKTRMPIEELDSEEDSVSGRFLWEDWRISDNLAINRSINDQWAWIIHNPVLTKFFKNLPANLWRLAGATKGLGSRFGIGAFALIAATQVSWEAVETVISWSLGLGGMHAACTIFNIAILSVTQSFLSAAQSLKEHPSDARAIQRFNSARKIWWNVLSYAYRFKKIYTPSTTEKGQWSVIKARKIGKLADKRHQEWLEALNSSRMPAAAYLAWNQPEAEASTERSKPDFIESLLKAQELGQRAIMIENWYRSRLFVLDLIKQQSLHYHFPVKLEAEKAGNSAWSRFKFYLAGRSSIGRMEKMYDRLRVSLMTRLAHAEGPHSEQELKQLKGQLNKLDTMLSTKAKAYATQRDTRCGNLLHKSL